MDSPFGTPLIGALPGLSSAIQETWTEGARPRVSPPLSILTMCARKRLHQKRWWGADLRRCRHSLCRTIAL